MIRTGADNVEKLKNSRSVTTHLGLACQSYGNIVHSGILLIFLLLLLSCSLPKDIKQLKDLLTRLHGMRPGRMACSKVINEDALPRSRQHSAVIQMLSSVFNTQQQQGVSYARRKLRGSVQYSRLPSKTITCRRKCDINSAMTKPPIAEPCSTTPLIALRRRRERGKQ